MTKITVAFSVIVCALLLTLTLGSPLDRNANLDLSGQDTDQEAKLLAQLQDAIKRAKAVNVEEQQPYSALGEIVQKDSVSEGRLLNILHKEIMKATMAGRPKGIPSCEKETNP